MAMAKPKTKTQKTFDDKKVQAKNPKSALKGEQKDHLKQAIKPGNAKGEPRVVPMPKEKMDMATKTKVQGGKAVGTAHGATFKMPKSKGKKRSKK